jgi:hypothetical protein
MDNNISSIEDLIKVIPEIKKDLNGSFNPFVYNKFGLKYFKEGSYKMVFENIYIPDIVIKYSVQQFNSGKEDYEYYQCAPKFFPKVYYYENEISVVERVKVYEDGINVDKAIHYFGINLKHLRNLIQESGYEGSFFGNLMYDNYDYKIYHLSDIFSIFINYKKFISLSAKKYNVKPIFDYLLSFPKLKEFVVECDRDGLD